jgi:hypothetical protein
MGRVKIDFRSTCRTEQLPVRVLLRASLNTEMNIQLLCIRVENYLGGVTITLFKEPPTICTLIYTKTNNPLNKRAPNCVNVIK